MLLSSSIEKQKECQYLLALRSFLTASCPDISVPAPHTVSTAIITGMRITQRIKGKVIMGKSHDNESAVRPALAHQNIASTCEIALA
jgi:hypothetical protein